MKVYFVGDYEQRELFDVIRRVLEQSGFEVVSWWMCHDGRRHYKNIMLNYQDIEKADIVIGFYPFGERAHSELTYALLKKKITILVIALGHAHQHPPIMYLVDEYKNGFIIDSSLFYEYIIDKKIDITQKEDLIDVLKQHHFKSSDFDPNIGKDTFQCIPKIDPKDIDENELIQKQKEVCSHMSMKNAFMLEHFSRQISKPYHNEDTFNNSPF